MVDTEIRYKKSLAEKLSMIKEANINIEKLEIERDEIFDEVWKSNWTTSDVGIQTLIRAIYNYVNKYVGDTWTEPSLASYTKTNWLTEIQKYKYLNPLEELESKKGDWDWFGDNGYTLNTEDPLDAYTSQIQWTRESCFNAGNALINNMNTSPLSATITHLTSLISNIGELPTPDAQSLRGIIDIAPVTYTPAPSLDSIITGLEDIIGVSITIADIWYPVELPHTLIPNPDYEEAYNPGVHDPYQQYEFIPEFTLGSFTLYDYIAYFDAYDYDGTDYYAGFYEDVLSSLETFEKFASLNNTLRNHANDIITNFVGTAVDEKLLGERYSHLFLLTSRMDGTLLKKQIYLTIRADAYAAVETIHTTFFIHMGIAAGERISTPSTSLVIYNPILDENDNILQDRTLVNIHLEQSFSTALEIYKELIDISETYSLATIEDVLGSALETTLTEVDENLNLIPSYEDYSVEAGNIYIYRASVEENTLYPHGVIGSKKSPILAEYFACDNIPATLSNTSLYSLTDFTDSPTDIVGVKVGTNLYFRRVVSVSETPDNTLITVSPSIESEADGIYLIRCGVFIGF